MFGALSAANAALAMVAGLFFLRFWRQTGDRLFASFALAFALLGAHWICLAATDAGYEMRPLFYGIRLVAFLVIIAGVVEKNRVRKAF